MIQKQCKNLNAQNSFAKLDINILLMKQEFLVLPKIESARVFDRITRNSLIYEPRARTGSVEKQNKKNKYFVTKMDEAILVTIRFLKRQNKYQIVRKNLLYK